jgi:RimJ/RimL family protein N-acetyltransferase
VRFPTWSRLKLAAAEARARIHERVLMFEAAASSTPSPEVRIVEPGEERRYELPYSRQTLSDNWANQWAIYAYFEQSVPVSFAWARVAREHRITEIRARVRAPREVGWIVHCVTPEAFRGRGYYPRLIRGVAEQLRSPRTYIYCVQANRGSQRGIVKAGYAAVGSISRTLGRLSNSAADLEAFDA